MELFQQIMMYLGLVVTAAISILVVVAPATRATWDNWLLKKLQWVATILAKLAEVFAPTAVTKALPTLPPKLKK